MALFKIHFVHKQLESMTYIIYNASEILIEITEKHAELLIKPIVYLNIACVHELQAGKFHSLIFLKLSTLVTF